MTDLTDTPATGPVDASASAMDSVMAEFERGDASPPEDAMEDAIRELTEQPSEGDAKAPDADEGEVETAEVEDQPEDPDDATPEEPAEPQPNARYTVKVNGEDVKVTFDELKKGYSRHQDYTAKTQALADEKRNLETTLKSDYANQLRQAADTFAKLDPILAEAAKIDWQALAQEDPAAYVQLRAAVDERQGALKAAREEVERVEKEQREAADTQRSEALKATEQAIRATDPAFSDDDKFTAYVNENVGELTTLGLDEDDMIAVLSNPAAGPRILSLVADARKWRAQQKAKSALPAKKVVPVSQAKPMRTDAGTGSQPRKAPPSNASRDAKLDWALHELTAQGT